MIEYTDKYLIVPIQPTWFALRLEPDGKYLTLWGKDKTHPYNGPYMGEVPSTPEYEDLVLIGCVCEYHRSDKTYNQILGRGRDDDGNHYLIIDRTEEHCDGVPYLKKKNI